MGKLRDAAAKVDKAWCKGNLRKEEESRGSGDTYCAIGAMASALFPDSLLTLGGDLIGPVEDVQAYDDLGALIASGLSTPDTESKIIELGKSFTATYYAIDGTEEARVLAEVILANYRDRVDNSYREPEKELEFNHPTTLIWRFNDHDDTTREDVIAMMEKADTIMEERVQFEDDEINELLEEVDSLIST